MKLKLIQSINEKKSQKGDVEFSNPHAEIAIKKARGRYAYLDSDMEAFVKMMQDDQKGDDQITGLYPETT